MDTAETRAFNGHDFQTFAVAPQSLKHGKTSTLLARTEFLNSGVQVVADGGETNLHAHTSQDEIWFVLSGAATFYTQDDAVVARLGQHEGLLIPHGAPYRFESASDENLVILRFGAAVPGAGPDRRIDLQQRTFAVKGEAGGVARPVEYVETHSTVESTRPAQRRPRAANSEARAPAPWIDPAPAQDRGSQRPQSLWPDALLVEGLTSGWGRLRLAGQ